jgi:thiopurine S-methyltransferase|tara:strand:- start:108 stop:803 length:696 start_codon:yes stop_codon:yes gene_type:complete
MQYLVSLVEGALNMQEKDWLIRWQKNQIGFHDAEVNSHLKKYISASDLKPGDTIFLPLCGKSADITWLAEQDFQVIGVELSAIAIESYFSEQGLSFDRVESGRFITRSSRNIHLLEGSFFDLRHQDLGDCSLVYDRASLIAFDEPTRTRYAQWMRSIIGNDTDILLVTLDYNQSEMNGPPFAVSTHEIMRHFESAFQIDIIRQTEIVDESPRWRSKGLSSLVESVYQLGEK